MGCKVSFNRSWQRGKQLDEDCKRAKISKNEYGINDNRLFCYGLIDTVTEEPLNKCLECRAFVHNAKPLKLK